MTLVILALLGQTAYPCNGAACLGARGQDSNLSQAVKVTVGPLGDGGSIYVEPTTNGVPLVIQGTQASGAATTPDVIIRSKNVHTGSGSIVSFRNGNTEVFAVNASGASGGTSASSGAFGFVDAGVGIVGGCTFNAGAMVCTTTTATTANATTTVGTTANLGFVDAGVGIVAGVTFNATNIVTAGQVTVGAGTGTIGAMLVSGSRLLLDAVSTGVSIVSAGVGLQVRSNATVIGSFNTGTGDFTVPIGFINNTDTSSGGGYRLNSKIVDTAVAPTLTGGCTSPSVTWNTGNAAFQVDVGTTCTGVSTITFVFPAATNGYECKCTNTTAAATRVLDSSAWSTTTVQVTNYSRTLGTAADFADGADLRCICRGG